MVPVERHVKVMYLNLQRRLVFDFTSDKLPICRVDVALIDSGEIMITITPFRPVIWAPCTRGPTAVSVMAELCSTSIPTPNPLQSRVDALEQEIVILKVTMGSVVEDLKKVKSESVSPAPLICFRTPDLDARLVDNVGRSIS